jgi:SAM-dependent methyltransferase
MTSRIERERDFHDRAFGEGTRAPVHKFYEIQHYDKALYEKLLASHAPDASALEYGCGAGSFAYFLARAGTESVTGIDISPVAIEQAAERADREGVADRCEFRVMDAERLDFADDSFDLICGTAILHHLDLDAAYGEIARTLRPDGHAVFFEPLGHNPAINAYRRRTPQYRTEDEHPLVMDDLELARSYFGEVDVTYFHLLTLLAVPFRRRRPFDALLRALHAADRGLFRIAPLRRYAWMAVIHLSGPMPPRRGTVPAAAG